MVLCEDNSVHTPAFKSVNKLPIVYAFAPFKASALINLLMVLGLSNLPKIFFWVFWKMSTGFIPVRSISSLLINHVGVANN
ncbi:hypothetical protein D3C80_2047100 [compost metagenome]